MVTLISTMLSKGPDPKRVILYDSNSIKVKIRKNGSIMTEIQNGDYLWGRKMGGTLVYLVF